MVKTDGGISPIPRNTNGSRKLKFRGMRRSSLLLGLFVCATALAADAFDVAGLHLNATTFYTKLHGADAGRWLVLFFSRNCGHCAAMLPAWQELQQQLAGERVRLGAVDVEAAKDVADRMDVHGFPTLMGIENSRLHEYHGGRSAEEMLAFIKSEDLSAVGRGSRRLPSAPSAWDPLLRVPDALVEIAATAVQTSPLATALLVAGLLAVGALCARATESLDAPYITVECPEGVRPGEAFTVEYLAGRTPLRPRGRKQRMQVIAPAGIAAGQTFFVPLRAPPLARAPPNKPDDKKD